MNPLLLSALAILIVSLISVAGVLSISINKSLLKRLNYFLVSFAVGSMFGEVFFHIVPEIAEAQGGIPFMTQILFVVGFFTFFVTEKFICWHHCHIPEAEGHNRSNLALINLVGDGLHNLIDGALIASSFYIDTGLGIATTIAVALHEIPQELADFGILHFAGLQIKKILALNFLTALTAFAGLAFVLLFNTTESLEAYALPLTAGAFIYLAGADLVPELHKSNHGRSVIVQTLGIILGLILMIALKQIA